MSLHGEALHWRSPEGRTVLDGVSLTLPPGAVLGLQGPSGCGKTTLARLLAGHLRPDRGRVILDGRPLAQHGRPCPVQLAPQAPELAVDPRWTVARILANAPQPPSPEVIAGLGVAGDWADRRPHELSGGQLQRVSLARLLTGSTSFLICDEITAQLDPRAAADLWRALLALVQARGIALLIISHDAQLLDRHCAAVACMTPDGRLTQSASGEPQHFPP